MRYTLAIALLLGISATSALGQVDTLQLQQISSFSAPNRIEKIYFEDINQDGIKEAIGCTSQNIYVYNPLNGNLLWTSPIIISAALAIVDFADMNADGDIDLAVKVSSNLYIFDVAHDSLIWTSPGFGSNSSNFGLGDRNSDGINDVIIAMRAPVTYSDPDIASIDVYDGPSFQPSAHLDFDVISRSIYHPEYIHNLYEVEDVGRAVVADLSSAQGIQRKIVLFMPIKVWNLWFDGDVWTDLVHWYGNYRIFDPINLSMANFNASGNMLSYSLYQDGNHDHHLFVYTCKSWWAHSYNDHENGYYNTRWYQVDRLSGDSVVSSPQARYYDDHTYYPQSLSSSEVTGEIDPANEGDELCYGAQDSLRIFSYPDISRIRSVRVDSAAYSNFFLYHSASLFSSPQILCKRPLIAYNGSNGLLSAVFPYDSLQPYKIIDLNNDGEDEIIEYNQHAFVNIYHVYNSSNGLDDNSVPLPLTYRLYSNYPNPFNASTVIKYDLPEASDVSIDIYDILGRKVENLLSEKQSAGSHSITWNAGDVPSGIYFYKIKAGNYTETKKCLFLK